MLIELSSLGFKYECHYLNEQALLHGTIHLPVNLARQQGLKSLPEALAAIIPTPLIHPGLMLVPFPLDAQQRQPETFLHGDIVPASVAAVARRR